MSKTKPLPPVTPKFSTWAIAKIHFMNVLQPTLWLVMILAGIQILATWAYTLYLKGVFDPISVQYSILVAVGSYFCLIMDQENIKKSMGIKPITYIPDGKLDRSKNEIH